ncbi:hypothetical protein OESDEN_20105 [Oesophagostomum dentatum]|uniref:Uncharacterized protein n=1 Tax=Oesophagostomum dentatum TaxID=61180 RepID=A0A0B1S4G1_OESDE|nr:hypothetical protein OESDEN_20105 [Oesophagostomum dentatum]
MRDRLCYGQVDAYALACAEDTPPMHMHLVPFCLAFKRHCSLVNYPADDWCAREFDRYEDFCTETKRRRCKSCSYDLSCYCEPYECLWRRHGFNTAVWCQRYELFCNERQRRKKANELIALMEDAVKIHYRCMHLFNLPKVICDPFRRQFDYNRCMKFLFDCELISEWDSGEEATGKEAAREGEGAEGPKKTLKPTPEDKKLAEKIAEEEKALERLLAEKEKEEKFKQNRKPESAAAPSAPSNVTVVASMSTASNFSAAETKMEATEKKPRSASSEHPFSNVKLPEIKN